MRTALANDPQPAFRKGNVDRKRYLYFTCGSCMIRWTAEKEATHAHFDFLVRVGHVRPDGTVLYRHGSEVQRAARAATTPLLPLRSPARAR